MVVELIVGMVVDTRLDGGAKTEVGQVLWVIEDITPKGHSIARANNRLLEGMGEEGSVLLSGRGEEGRWGKGGDDEKKKDARNSFPSHLYLILHSPDGAAPWQ